jgi:hypothetical protein
LDERLFRVWLTQRSWDASVRYCKVVALLMLPTALVFHAPAIRSGTIEATAPVLWLLAWQLLVVMTCLSVLAIDRWMPQMRSRELPPYNFCAIFMALTIWAGVRGSLIGSGGLVIYAAGSTFVAAVICTPRPVRRAMYVISMLALAVPTWLNATDAAAMLEAMWAGVRGSLIGSGGLVIYAAGSTFVAAVICTPRPVRRPMYVISMLALAVPTWLNATDAAAMLEAMVHPFCVTVLCIELEKVTW